MKKNIVIVILAVLLIVSLCLILWQKKNLDRYEHGYDLKGTYVSETSDAYILFPEENGTFETYKPFGRVKSGTYEQTNAENVYSLEYDGRNAGYVVLGKDSITYLYGGEAEIYSRMSDVLVYNSTKEQVKHE